MPSVAEYLNGKRAAARGRMRTEAIRAWYKPQSYSEW